MPQQGISKNLRSLSRLAYGGLLLASDGLAKRLQRWDESAEDEIERVRGVIVEPRAATAVHTAIGVAVSYSERVEETLEQVTRIRIDLELRSKPVFRKIGKTIESTRPTALLLGSIVERVERMAEIGRGEEQRGLAIARSALEELQRSTLSIFADNSDVRNMVRNQSAGLAKDLVEVVREQTMLADDRVEGIVKSLVRIGRGRSDQTGDSIEITQS